MSISWYHSSDNFRFRVFFFSIESLKFHSRHWLRYVYFKSGTDFYSRSLISIAIFLTDDIEKHSYNEFYNHSSSSNNNRGGGGGSSSGYNNTLSNITKIIQKCTIIIAAAQKRASSEMIIQIGEFYMQP